MSTSRPNLDRWLWLAAGLLLLAQSAGALVESGSRSTNSPLAFKANGAISDVAANTWPLASSTQAQNGSTPSQAGQSSQEAGGGGDESGKLRLKGGLPAHRTRVTYQSVPLNLADLMLASASIPAGRRRLDSQEEQVRFVQPTGLLSAPTQEQLINANQLLLDANGQGGVEELASLLAGPETLVASGALNRALNRRPPVAARADPNLLGAVSPFAGIVDNGPAGGGSLAPMQPASRYPSAQLLAKLASDEYNRVALASALRQQQSMVNGAVGGRRRAASRRVSTNEGRRRPQQQQQQYRPPGKRQRLALEESRARSAASRGRGQRGSQGASRSGRGEDEDEGDEGDEGDELDSRSDDESSSNQRNRGDDDDDDLDEPAARRASENYFNDDERRADGHDDELPAPSLASDDNGDERPRLRAQTNSLDRGRAGVRLSQAASRQAAGRNLLLGRDELLERSAARRPAWQTAGRRHGRVEADDLGRTRYSQADEGPVGDGELDGPGERPELRRPGQGAGGELVAARRSIGVDSYEPTSGAQLDVSAGLQDSDLSAASHIRNSNADLEAAAGHQHDHGHGHYYQFVEVPKKKAWKFGFKRGNHKHTIMRKEKGYKNKFHSEFKWHAKEKCKKKSKCESVGKMKWEYKHHDKKHHG